MFFSDEMLQSIREKIACPQFGDNHYGEWGILNLNQRRTIRGLLDYIEMLRAERGKLINGIEYKKVIIALKTQIDLADLNKTTVATEVPLSTFTDALLLINNLVTEINKQQAEIEDARIGVKSYKGKYESAVETVNELQTVIAEKDATIKGLQMLLYSFLDTRNGNVVQITDTKLEVIKKPIKAEAIKEFVAKMEMLFECNYNDDHCISIHQIKNHIHKTAEILEKEYDG